MSSVASQIGVGNMSGQTSVYTAHAFQSRNVDSRTLGAKQFEFHTVVNNKGKPQPHHTLFYSPTPVPLPLPLAVAAEPAAAAATFICHSVARHGPRSVAAFAARVCEKYLWVVYKTGTHSFDLRVVCCAVTRGNVRKEGRTRPTVALLLDYLEWGIHANSLKGPGAQASIMDSVLFVNSKNWKRLTNQAFQPSAVSRSLTMAAGSLAFILATFSRGNGP